MNIDIKPFNATEAEASLDLKPHNIFVLDDLASKFI